MQRNPIQRNGAGGPGPCRFARAGRAAPVLAILAMLVGCETLNGPPADTDSGVESPAAEAPEPYSYKRAFELLFEGQADRAERMLEARLATSPGDEQARYVLRQIQVDPTAYLGESSFEYEVKPGETLSVLSQRFLGTYRLFFILARYNNIDTPSLLRVGQVLRIPDSFAGKAAAGSSATRSVPIGSRETSMSGEPLEDESPEETLAKYSGVEVDALGRMERARLGAAYRRWVDDALVRGDTGEAKDRLREAARRAPADGRWKDWLDDMKRRVEAQASYQEGLDLRRLEPAAAAQAFHRTLNVDPAHAGARTALDELRRHAVPRLHREAVILYRNQELDEAIEIWNQILAIDPGFEPAQGYRTRAMELRRRLEQLD